MQQRITSNHWNDENGNPAGGSTYGVGFAISWQNGPLGRGPERHEPNGAFVEDIIEAARDRLLFYQNGKFACDDNQTAIIALEKALISLEKRTHDRETRNVEGTHAL